MDLRVEEFLHSPKLALYVDKFQRVLDLEKKRRAQFYEQMTEDQKTEFINGEVLVHSPVKLRHSRVGDNLYVLLHAYVRKHNLGSVGHEKILITLTRNDYERISAFSLQKSHNFLHQTRCNFPHPILLSKCFRLPQRRTIAASSIRTMPRTA